MSLFKKIAKPFKSFSYLLFEIKLLFNNFIILRRLNSKSSFSVLYTPIRIGDNIIQLPYYSSFNPNSTIVLNFERLNFCKFLTAHRNILYMRFYFESINRLNLSLTRLYFEKIKIESVIKCSIFHGFKELVIFRWLFQSRHKSIKFVYEGETVHYFDINKCHLLNYTIVKNVLLKPDFYGIDAPHLIHLQSFWSQMDLNIDEMNYRNYYLRTKENLIKNKKVKIRAGKNILFPLSSKEYRSFNSLQISQISSELNLDEIIGKKELDPLLILNKIVNAKKIYGVENGLVLLALLFDKDVTIFLGGGDYQRFHPFYYSYCNLNYITSSRYRSCFQCHWNCKYLSETISQVPCMDTLNLDFNKVTDNFEI